MEVNVYKWSLIQQDAEIQYSVPGLLHCVIVGDVTNIL
jgi:hypothetical protein